MQRCGNLIEKQRTALFQQRSHACCCVVCGQFRKRSQLQIVVDQIQTNAAVVGAGTVESTPEDFSLNEQFIQICVPIICDTRRQDFGLQCGSRQWCALKLFDDIQNTVQPSARLIDAVPFRKKTGQRFGFDRFDFAAQSRQTATLQLTQNVRITPLLPLLSRQESTMNNTVLSFQIRQRRQHRRHAQPQSSRHRRSGERAMCSSVARNQIDQRSLDRSSPFCA